MIRNINFRKHIRPQNIAKETINYLSKKIKAGMTEAEIVKIAERYMKKRGSTRFWYYNKGALVYTGENSLISVSGKEYEPSEVAAVKDNDIVTIDLGPEVDGAWGDYARTLIIQNGKVVSVLQTNIENRSVINGYFIVNLLHNYLLDVVRPDLACFELHEIMNKEIEKVGFENLDFHGNLGHSIATDLPSRVFIESGEKTLLGELGLFTFEPHLKEIHGNLGFKREDIYYFLESGRLLNL